MADGARFRGILLWVGVAYILAVLFITLWPVAVTRFNARAIHYVLLWLHANQSTRWVGYVQLEALSNVALFVPLGVLLTLTVGAVWSWSVPIIGCLLSSLIETAQLLFLPGRYASLDDVLHNTIGAALGTLFALAALGIGRLLKKARPL